MKQVLFYLLIFVNNAFCSMKPHQVDGSGAVSSTSVIVLVILNVLLLLFSYKKASSMLGR
jgi:hypothetical protein